MGVAGIFGEDERVELIAGEIYQMHPIGGPHVMGVIRLNHLLVRQIGDRVLISVQSLVRLSNDGEPQPDLSVLRDRDYGAARSHSTCGCCARVRGRQDEVGDVARLGCAHL